MTAISSTYLAMVTRPFRIGCFRGVVVVREQLKGTREEDKAQGFHWHLGTSLNQADSAGKLIDRPSLPMSLPLNRLKKSNERYLFDSYKLPF